MRSMLGLLALFAAGSALEAQQKVVLGKPDAETTESFTTITAIRELPSGKVLVADSRDKIVQLVDLATGSMTKVGREGNGPGEYAMPAALAGLPDGSTLIHDLLNRRFLTVGPDGKPGAFLELPRPAAAPSGSGGGPTFLLGGITRVQGWDNQGRLYFAGSPFSATGGTADSIALMRWDRVKPTYDTIGYLKQPAGSASRTSNASGTQVMMRLGNNIIFSPSEVWAVAGDGSIARVIPEPYHVVWMSGRGAPVVGATVPYTPIKVTEADKQAIIEQQKKNPGMTVRFGGGGGGGGGPAPQVQAPTPEFAETKPAYFAPPGQGPVVLASLDGEAWVLRSRVAGDKVPTYDVFDKSGKLVRKVSLSPNSRVVGFGKGTVYVVRTDDDDLQYLQRFVKPGAEP